MEFRNWRQGPNSGYGPGLQGLGSIKALYIVPCVESLRVWGLGLRIQEFKV